MKEERNTSLDEVTRSLTDEPAEGWSAWARTTAGIVAMLLALQFVTGALLTFYYLPSTEGARTTVAYMEKVAGAGSWLRSLHHYGSQLVTLFLVLHLAQMFWRRVYERKPVAWIATVLLIAFVMANGATGYSLPWDARAFYSTRVAEGMASGLPLVGETARRWLLGGTEISPLTLVRFYALHVLVIPFLILLIATARLFIFREVFVEDEARRVWAKKQFARNSVAAGLVFIALALFSSRTRAPLGPPATELLPGYLPRPGAQFLWLFQLLKYLPGRITLALAATLLVIILLTLLALPFLKRRASTETAWRARKIIGRAIFATMLAAFFTLTALAYIGDMRDTRVREQLARQRADEQAFLNQPFEPLRMAVTEEQHESSAQGNSNSSGNANSPKTLSSSQPPASYVKNCSSCHGSRGQGFFPYPKLLGVAAKPNRTVEDLIALMNNPESYGLKPPMKSFAGKLSEAEEREIAEWIETLQKPAGGRR